MTYDEAIERLSGYKERAEEDAKAGLLYMTNLYEMALSLTAQTFDKTEPQVKADIVKRSRA